MRKVRSKTAALPGRHHFVCVIRLNRLRALPQKVLRGKPIEAPGKLNQSLIPRRCIPQLPGVRGQHRLAAVARTPRRESANNRVARPPKCRPSVNFGTRRILVRVAPAPVRRRPTDGLCRYGWAFRRPGEDPTSAWDPGRRPARLNPSHSRWLAAASNAAISQITRTAVVGLSPRRTRRCERWLVSPM